MTTVKSGYLLKCGKGGIVFGRGYREMFIRINCYEVRSKTERMRTTLSWHHAKEMAEKNCVDLDGYKLEYGRNFDFSLKDAAGGDRRSVDFRAKSREEMFEWGNALGRAIAKANIQKRRNDLFEQARVALQDASAMEKRGDIEIASSKWKEGTRLLTETYRTDSVELGLKTSEKTLTVLRSYEAHIAELERKLRSRRPSPSSSATKARRPSVAEALSVFVGDALQRGMRETLMSKLKPADFRDGVDDPFQRKLRPKFKIDGEDVTLKAYAPEKYKELRRLCYMSDNRDPEQVFLDSMCKDKLTGGLTGDGKSSSLFYFTHDKRFILKTLSPAEHAFLLGKVAPLYYAYIKEYRKTSLLVRFWAHVSLESKRIGKIYFIVMENLTFATRRGIKFHRTFDLKGSTVNRKVKTATPAKTTLKDLNLTDEDKIVLPVRDARRLKKQLERDSDFLRSLGIMDYSLLLKVRFGTSQRRSLNLSEDRSAEATKSPVGDHRASGRFSVDGIDRKGTEYRIAVIDILQEYNILKKGETAGKSLLHDPEAISAVHPDLYKTRFDAFMASSVIVENDGNYGYLVTPHGRGAP